MVKEGVLKDVGEEYAKHNATECNVFRDSETCLVALKSLITSNDPKFCFLWQSSACIKKTLRRIS